MLNNKPSYNTIFNVDEMTQDYNLESIEFIKTINELRKPPKLMQRIASLSTSLDNFGCYDKWDLTGEGFDGFEINEEDKIVNFSMSIETCKFSLVEIEDKHIDTVDTQETQEETEELVKINKKRSHSAKITKWTLPGFYHK